jgi:hypothetical protein
MILITLRELYISSIVPQRHSASPKSYFGLLHTAPARATANCTADRYPCEASHAGGNAAALHT